MSLPEELEPESVPLGAQRKRRTMMLAGIAAGVVVVAGAGFYLLSSSLDRKAQARIEEANSIACRSARSAQHPWHPRKPLRRDSATSSSLR